ncbi:MAG: hypothetical protein IAF94_09730 [Pirellulaceae bacterium]|nr:hypothetical protein [Pirellulaceae bacterium]
MTRFIASLLTGCLALGCFSSIGFAKDKWLEGLRRDLKRLVERLGTSPEKPFILTEGESLLARAKSEGEDSSRGRRFEEAAEDLINAGDQMRRLRQGSEGDDDPKELRARTARRLERSYFRVQQADYFAKWSDWKSSPAYVKMARQLYQRARSAYDRQSYTEAKRLAEASSELVNVLENLAQAAQVIPDPPRLR